MGERQSLTLDTIRQAAAKASQKARSLKVAQCTIQLPMPEGVSTAAMTQAITEGAELGLYNFLEYKTEPSESDTHIVHAMTIMVDDSVDVHEAQQGITIGQTIVRGVCLARNLVNAPGNSLTPAQFGIIAEQVGNEVGLSITVFDELELEQQGFGGLLAVGKGSANPPRFIIMEHGKDLQNVPTICLVGKGITFDTGGISIKPSAEMDQMKYDMAGAAAVMGAMRAVAELQLPLHVVGIISSAENMPSATAYKPGDIVRTLSGKTVEVLNTDAEGRIVLADGLFYAQRYEPTAVFNAATLTGAMRIALGEAATGVMGNNQSVIDRLSRAGEASRERGWQLPLWDEYREMVKSDIADVKNVAGRMAGSITAAAFLETFVGSYPWAHLDIAGTAWSGKSPRAYESKGATGVGVRLFVQLLRDWSHVEGEV
jgi:leucyl aminopeptidase